jgi:hypothetical protein
MHEPGVYFMTASSDIIAGNEHICHPTIQLLSKTTPMPSLTFDDVVQFCSNLNLFSSKYFKKTRTDKSKFTAKLHCTSCFPNKTNHESAHEQADESIHKFHNSFQIIITADVVIRFEINMLYFCSHQPWIRTQIDSRNF